MSLITIGIMFTRTFNNSGGILGRCLFVEYNLKRKLDVFCLIFGGANLFEMNSTVSNLEPLMTFDIPRSI